MKTTAARKRLPPAPPGFDYQAFIRDADWFQRWEMFDGVFTPGGHDMAQLARALHLPEDLTGKRVLDIGPWNGCLSFECERRGAREVIAMGPESPVHTGFYRIRDAIGSTRVHYRLGTVYDLDPDKLGKFDVVLFCGVLYHLRYPILGIDHLRRICTGEVYVETHVSDCELDLRGGPWWRKLLRPFLTRGFRAAPLWKFYRNLELSNDPSNWFGPNTEAVLQAFQSAGFDVEHLSYYHGQRATFRARIKPGTPEFLAIPSGERMFYDVLVSHLFGRQPFLVSSPTERQVAETLASEAYYHRSGNSLASWVGSVYRDLLGRPPEAAEMRHSLERLGRGSVADRQAVAADLLSCPEYHLRLVTGCYQKFLGRTGGPHELPLWIRELHVRAKTDEEVIAHIIASEESVAHRGGDSRRWLEYVYRELLEREPGPEAHTALAALQAGTKTYEEVAAEITGSPEFRPHLFRLLQGFPSLAPARAKSA
jgi:tRNA (mo5U34)-methyltransferase